MSNKNCHRLGSNLGSPVLLATSTSTVPKPLSVTLSFCFEFVYLRPFNDTNIFKYILCLLTIQINTLHLLLKNDYTTCEL